MQRDYVLLSALCDALCLLQQRSQLCGRLQLRMLAEAPCSVHDVPRLCGRSSSLCAQKQAAHSGAGKQHRKGHLLWKGGREKVRPARKSSSCSRLLLCPDGPAPHSRLAKR